MQDNVLHDDATPSTSPGGRVRPQPQVGPSMLTTIVLLGEVVAFLLAMGVFMITMLPGIELAQEASTLQARMRHDLPRGTTLTRTRNVLASGDLSRVLASHGYGGSLDRLPSQVYPGGSMFEVPVFEDWNRGIELDFFFDGHGNLLRCEARSHYFFALG